MIFAVRTRRSKGACRPFVLPTSPVKRDRVGGLHEQRALAVEQADGALAVHAPQHRLAGGEVAGHGRQGNRCGGAKSHLLARRGRMRVHLPDQEPRAWTTSRSATRSPTAFSRSPSTGPTDSTPSRRRCWASCSTPSIAPTPTTTCAPWW